MVTKTEEREITETGDEELEEPTAPSAEVETPEDEEGKGEKEIPEVSKAEGEKVKSPEPITFKNQTELDKHLEKKAQTLATSIANKSTVTYQKQINDLKSQLKEATDHKEDDAIEHLLKAQTDEWGATKEVGEFQDAVKNFVKERRAFRDEKAQWGDNHEKATQSVKEVNAFTDALALLLPDDDAGFISTLTELAEKIAGAETDREKELLIELEKAKLQAKAEAQAEPKPKRTKPDSGLGSTPGNLDLRKLSADEVLRRGFKKELSK